MKISSAPIAVVVALLGAGAAHAAPPADANARARCALRLSASLLGKSPDAALLASSDPQSAVDTLLASGAFIERFARFINASFNADPGATPSEDPAYYLTKYLLQNNRPWKELFVGRYNVDLPAGATMANQVAVTADPNGLGYFRSTPWLLRYAGNELEGLKIVTAYRIMNNVLGLKLTAVTNVPGADISATGRMAQPCAQCHYMGPFALDLVARTLTRKQTSGTKVTFVPSPDGPQTILGGISIADDEQLVTTLVDSDAFRFRACRLAFEFLYGRPENKCEGAVFDQCMAAFTQAGTIQSALAAVAKDSSFCQ